MIKYITISVLVLAAVVSADVPHLLNYQGRITNDSGTPLDGSHALTFRIYDDSTGGTTLWTETHDTVTVADGLFNVVLGSVVTIESSIFSSQPRWLGIQVDPGPELAPRTQIIAVAYAYRAEHADTADFAHDGGGGGGWIDDGTSVRLATGSDRVGIGTSDPQEKLQVNGDIRLLSSSDIAFGSDNNRLYSASSDMVITADDDLHLQPDDDIYIRKDGSSAWVHYDNSSEKLGIGITNPVEKLHVENVASEGLAFLQLESSHSPYWGECGLRLVTPANRWHLRMDDHSNNNLPIEGSLALRSHNSGKEVMTWTNAGDVGIGDTSPDAKLDVNGDLEVSGAYRGNITSSSGSDGAPFPRPAYNSGWVSIEAGETIGLYHNVGGNVDDYVIDLQAKSDPSLFGITNFRTSGEKYYHLGSANTETGVMYLQLSLNTIQVVRFQDENEITEIRVRIWVIE
jgi:hypothetical protein